MKFSNVAATALFCAAGAYAMSADEFKALTETKDNKVAIKADSLKPFGKVVQDKLKALIKDDKVIEDAKLATELVEITKLIDADKKKIDDIIALIGDKSAEDLKKVTDEDLKKVGLTRAQFDKFVALKKEERNITSLETILAEGSIMGHLSTYWLYYTIGGVVVVAAAAGAIYYMKKGESEETDL